MSDDGTKEGRYRYSLGHELGHVFYHREKYERERDNSLVFDFEGVNNDTDKRTIIACRSENIEAADATCANNWEEWQADYFSACLLMPSVSVGVFIKPYLNKQNFALNGEIGYPLSQLPTDKQMSIVDGLMKTYGVSRQAARIRLKMLGIMR